MAAHRTSTGVAGLDPLIDGGFPANRAILLRGESGTGKTTFGLQFLADGVRRGEAGIFLSTDEKPRHVLEDARSFGWDLEGAFAGGALAVLDASPYFTATRRWGWTHSGIDARQVAADLVREVRTVYAQRLVIDSLTSLVPLDMSAAQVHDYLRSLIQSLEDNLGCTVLMTWRASSDVETRIGSEAAAYLTSGVLDLNITKIASTYARTLLVRKMRGTSLDLVEYLFSIEPEWGVVIESRAAAAIASDL